MQEIFFFVYCTKFKDGNCTERTASHENRLGDKQIVKKLHTLYEHKLPTNDIFIRNYIRLEILLTIKFSFGDIQILINRRRSEKWPLTQRLYVVTLEQNINYLYKTLFLPSEGK